MTLVAIYGPNDDNPDFFQSLKSTICLYENTSVIVVGDWNVVQNYDKDTINYHSENNPRAQVKVHQMMNDLDLVDIWRVQHPRENRFSWWDPHKKTRNTRLFLYFFRLRAICCDIRYRDQ